MPNPKINRQELERKLTATPLERQFQINQRNIDSEARTAEVAFSSEIEGERWGYIEILDHSPGAVRLERLNNGGAVLMDHNRRDQVGVINKGTAKIDSDRRGRAQLRFGKSERASEVFTDVEDEIRQHVSVGYRVHKYEVEERQGEPDIVRVTDWEPIEISIVSVPLDDTVGVGRDAGPQTDSLNEEGTQMPKPNEAEQRSGDTPAPVEQSRTAEPAPVAPAQVNVEQIRAQERQRMAEIGAVAEQSHFDLGDLQRDAISKGWSVEQFRAAAFEHVIANQTKAPAQRASEEMLARENQEYSLVRAIAAQVEGDWSQAGFEREMSQELARQGGVIGGGLLVPAHVLAQRSSDTTTAAGLIGTAHRPDLFIDTLRANTVLGRAGATFIPGLTGKFSAPKKTGNAQFGFVAEKEEATESQVGAGKVEMGGKHISGFVNITFEMLRQSSPAIEQIVRSDMMEGMALAIDLAGLQGDGQGNNPLGILSTAGIHTVTAGDTAGKIPTWAEILKLEGLLDDANALNGKLAYLFRSTVASTLKGVPKDAGSGKFVIENKMCNDHAAISTTQLPPKGTLFGNFADFWIGTWGAVELIPERNTKTGGLDIGCHQMVDMVARHAQSFAKIV